MKQLTVQRVRAALAAGDAVVTVPEAAAYCGVSRPAVHAWVRAGLVPAVVSRGKTRMLLSDVVEAEHKTRKTGRGRPRLQRSRRGLV